MSEDNKDQKAFSPEDVDVIIDERKRDQDEFGAAFDELISGKSDEELLAEKETKPEADEFEGDSPEGESSKSDQSQEPDGNDGDSATDKSATEADSVPDEIDYKARSEELAELLAKEQQRNSTWHGRIKAANEKAKKAEARIAELEKEVEAAKANVEPARNSDSEDAYDDLNEFFSDFPELKDNVTKLIQKKAGNTQPKQTEDTEDVTPESPVPDVETEDRSEFDMKLTEAHSDWQYHITTGKLLKWIHEGAPDYMKDTFLAIFKNGTADACINLLNEYKRDTNQASADNGGTKPKTKPKSDKQAKIDAMKEVKSSGANVGNNLQKSKKDMSFDEAAREAGLV